MSQEPLPSNPLARSSLIRKLTLAAAFFFLLTLGVSIWLIRAYVLQPPQTINLPAPAPPPARTSSGSKIPTFSGSVIDAQTHQPLDDFFAIVGYKLNPDQPAIIFDAAYPRTRPFRTGQYQLSPAGQQFPNTTWFVRIEARGYLPAVSTAQTSSAKINFELTPSKDMIGRVVGADGKPAANVSLAVSFAGSMNTVSVQNGKLSVSSATPAASAADGSFDLPPQIGNFLIAACSPDGYAEATQDDFARSTDLHLLPWGRVEGRVLLGTKPQAKALVMLSSGTSADWKPVVFAYASAATDADGHFVLTNVRPGPVQISRLVTIQSGPHNQAAGASTLTTKTTVEPGKTTTINLGGTGRQVVGKAIIPDAVAKKDYYLIGQAIPTASTPIIPQMPDGIRNSSPVVRTLWMQTFISGPDADQYLKDNPHAMSQAAELYHWLEFHDNNSFQITNLSAGNYLYQVYAKVSERGGAVRLAEGHSDFNIPPLAPGNLDQPFQIPDLTLTPVFP